MEAAYVSQLDSITFDRFLEDQNPCAIPCEAISIKGVRFVTPAALVQLAAMCHSCARSGTPFAIEVDDQAVRSYLMRSGFKDVVDDVAEFVPPMASSIWYSGLRGGNPLLIEVTRIVNGRELPELLDRIVAVLRTKFKYRKYDAFDVATAVSEIAQNTFDHNVGTCGFIAMQGYSKGQRRFLEIGVSDFGVGLAETLRRNPKNGPIPDDLTAIKRAMQLHQARRVLWKRERVAGTALRGR